MSLWTDEVMSQLEDDHEMTYEDAEDLIQKLRIWLKYRPRT